MTDRLGMERSDLLAAILKGAAGVMPLVGQLLGEAIGVVLPNQRLDRVADFARQLSERVDRLTLDVSGLRRFLATDEGLEVLYVVLQQTARSLSQERRGYLANILISAAWSTDFELERSTVLLRTLDQLTDAEVVWLRFFAIEDDVERQEFARQFEAVIHGIDPTSPILRDRERRAVQEAQLQNMKTVGVVSGGGAIAVTELGRMLLREIQAARRDEAE